MAKAMLLGHGAELLLDGFLPYNICETHGAKIRISRSKDRLYSSIPDQEGSGMLLYRLDGVGLAQVLGDLFAAGLYTAGEDGEELSILI